MSSSTPLHLGTQQNPVSRRRLARDIAEMVNEPYPNTKLTPNPGSLDKACLALKTGTRIVHASLSFDADYPRLPPVTSIDGRARHLRLESLLCSAALMSGREDKSAYTIKNYAMHLLSTFDGNTELGEWSPGIELRFQSGWEDYTCNLCGIRILKNGRIDIAFLRTHLDCIDLGGDESPIPLPTISGGPTKPKTIQDLPLEILNDILDHLEVQDIVRFSQAWEEIANIVETNVVIRDRELQCFVTKEHFTRSPLGIGIDADEDDDYSRPPRPFELESEFDLISQAAFRDLGIRTSAYGCKFSEWLPLPLSERHWERVKGDAFQCLDGLAEWMYNGFLHSPDDSDALDVLTILMDEHVLKLFTNVQRRPTRGGTSGERAWGDTEPTGHLEASEKGIESLFFLFHLLLCVAIARPELVDKANNMVRSFQAGSPPAEYLPDPGRILVALLISDVRVDTSFTVNIIAEAITRNVPDLLVRHPELSYLEPDGAASAYRLHHTFMASLASYRALMFMDTFQRTVRPSTNNGTTLKQARDALFRRHGFPPPATTAYLDAETRRILAVDSFPGCLAYLGMLPVPGARYLSGALRDTVREYMRRYEMTSPLEQDEMLVLRRTAEHWSTLPRTEGLPPCPEWPPCWEVIARAQAFGYYP